MILKARPVWDILPYQGKHKSIFSQPRTLSRLSDSYLRRKQVTWTRHSFVTWLGINNLHKTMFCLEHSGATRANLSNCSPAACLGIKYCYVNEIAQFYVQSINGAGGTLTVRVGCLNLFGIHATLTWIFISIMFLKRVATWPTNKTPRHLLRNVYFGPESQAIRLKGPG